MYAMGLIQLRPVGTYYTCTHRLKLYKFPRTDQPSVNRKQINKRWQKQLAHHCMVYVVSGVEAKWSNLTALKSSLLPHAEIPYAKVKAFDCTVC